MLNRLYNLKKNFYPIIPQKQKAKAKPSFVYYIPKFIWAPVYSCTHGLRPHNSPPPPACGLIYEDAIGQPG